MTTNEVGVNHYVEEIPNALAGQRIDRVVSIIADISRSLAAGLISGLEVKVNDQVVSKSSFKVSEGDKVEFSYEVLDDSPVADDSIKVEIVFQDDDVIVIEKAPGQIVHPGAGNKSGTIANGLLAVFPELSLVGQADRPGVVHRLDKETSGLLMVARSQRAYDSLTHQLRQRTATRTYLALVEGEMNHSEGKIDAPLGRSSNDPTRQAIVADGKPAITHYVVERQFDEAALVRCNLETGRTHQIRLHMSSIGHAVFGDVKYGSKFDIGEDRIFLHATELSFHHPSTGKVMTFASELPEDLAKQLNKHS